MEDVKTKVRERYAKAAACCDTGTATSLGYTEAELAAVPQEVTTASLGCGSPVTPAELRPGERVLDLGSGAGLDVFLASREVGPTGIVYGLDFTPEMLERARASARREGLDNVTFLEGDIESIPLPEASVDVVISNCVINLAPDKSAVFREAHRVLAPGGRFVVADMLAKGALAAAVVADADAWCSCLAGAIPENDYVASLRAAGFREVEVKRTGGGGDACCGPEVFSALIVARA